MLGQGHTVQAGTKESPSFQIALLPAPRLAHALRPQEPPSVSAHMSLPPPSRMWLLWLRETHGTWDQGALFDRDQFFHREGSQTTAVGVLGAVPCGPRWPGLLASPCGKPSQAGYSHSFLCRSWGACAPPGLMEQDPCV